MSNQVTKQAVVKPGGSIDPNKTTEVLQLFDESGDPIALDGSGGGGGGEGGIGVKHYAALFLDMDLTGAPVSGTYNSETGVWTAPLIAGLSTVNTVGDRIVVLYDGETSGEFELTNVVAGTFARVSPEDAWIYFDNQSFGDSGWNVGDDRGLNLISFGLVLQQFPEDSGDTTMTPSVFGCTGVNTGDSNGRPFILFGPIEKVTPGTGLMVSDGDKVRAPVISVDQSSFITVVQAGGNLSAARPFGMDDNPGPVYWVFDQVVVAGSNGENIVNFEPGDLFFVPEA